MASHRGHITFSTLVAAGYAAAGIQYYDMLPEHVLLASVIIVIAGMLPDIDAGGSAPSRELGGLLAAISPIAVLEFYPDIKTGGVTRIALVVVASYLFTRVFVVRGLKKFTVHRGMIHSLPAAIILFEITYLMFLELVWVDRMYISLAALVGFLSHLVLDSWSNVDLLKGAMGQSESKGKPLKLFGDSSFATVVMYCCALVLGWFVSADFYPEWQQYWQ